MGQRTVKRKSKHQRYLEESERLGGNVKRCLDCDELKPIDEFHHDKKIRGGRRTHCLECARERSREYTVRYNQKNIDKVLDRTRQYRLNNPEKHRNSARKSYHKRKRVKPEQVYQVRRNWRLLSTYGISSEIYQQMLDAQSGQCAICKQTEVKHQRGLLHVDHCHRSGKVRALLCSFCNQALGSVRESIDILKAMIVYLQLHQANAT